MSQSRSFDRTDWRLLGLAGLLFLACWGFHLKYAHDGTPLYRDQHLGTAVEYSRTSLDFRRPVIIGFNATGTPTPQEFPAWQLLAGLAFKLLGPWYGWANVVSLLVFSTALFPLYEVTRLFSGARHAAWTLVFFLSQPLIFVFAGEAGTDGFSLAAAIWFLYFAVRLLRTPTLVWCLLTSLAGILTALSKLPFFMAAGMAAFLLLLTRHAKSKRSWVLLAVAGAASAAIFFKWQSYTNFCAGIAEFPFVDLRLSNPAMQFWYFGDWHYRLNPANWIKGGWRLLNCCFGSFALIALFLDGLLFRRRDSPAKALLAGFALTILVFTHLILHHSHYYLILCPAVAMLSGLSAMELEEKIKMDRAWKSRLQMGVVAIVLILSLIQGLIGMKIVLDVDPYPYEMAKIIGKYCGKSDRLLIEGGGWGGNELMLSDRKGLSIWSTAFLENPDTLLRLKKLGYNKLVMMSESPLLTALQQVNPGQSKTPRESYRLTLTSVADSWPTLYESEDILIKEIP